MEELSGTKQWYRIKKNNFSLSNIEFRDGRVDGAKSMLDHISHPSNERNGDFTCDLDNFFPD